MRSGLNQEFYKWVDEVRKAIRKKAELEDKIKYYERRLNSCKSVSYYVVGGRSGTRTNEDNQIFWLDKIEITKSKIKDFDLKINQYKRIKSSSTILERQILEKIIINQKSIRLIAKDLGVSSSMVMKQIHMLCKVKDFEKLIYCSNV